MWQHLRCAPLLYLELPFDERLKNIMHDYAQLPCAELQSATSRIAKRLGFDLEKKINAYLEQGVVETAFDLLLKYYDKMYTEATQKRPQLDSILHTLPFDEYNASVIAKQIISYTFARNEHNS
jgi:tRNA 2-selenouridine synthase